MRRRKLSKQQQSTPVQNPVRWQYQDYLKLLLFVVAALGIGFIGVFLFAPRLLPEKPSTEDKSDSLADPIAMQHKTVNEFLTAPKTTQRTKVKHICREWQKRSEQPLTRPDIIQRLNKIINIIGAKDKETSEIYKKLFIRAFLKAREHSQSVQENLDLFINSPSFTTYGKVNLYLNKTTYLQAVQDRSIPVVEPGGFLDQKDFSANFPAYEYAPDAVDRVVDIIVHEIGTHGADAMRHPLIGFPPADSQTVLLQNPADYDLYFNQQLFKGTLQLSPYVRAADAPRFIRSMQRCVNTLQKTAQAFRDQQPLQVVASLISGEILTAADVSALYQQHFPGELIGNLGPFDSNNKDHLWLYQRYVDLYHTNPNVEIGGYDATITHVDDEHKTISLLLTSHEAHLVYTAAGYCHLNQEYADNPDEQLAHLRGMFSGQFLTAICPDLEAVNRDAHRSYQQMLDEVCSLH